MTNYEWVLDEMTLDRMVELGDITPCYIGWFHMPRIDDGACHDCVSCFRSWLEAEHEEDR